MVKPILKFYNTYTSVSILLICLPAATILSDIFLRSLPQISLGATSRCVLHDKSWMRKVSLSWMKHSGTIPPAVEMAKAIAYSAPSSSASKSSCHNSRNISSLPTSSAPSSQTLLPREEETTTVSACSLGSSSRHSEEQEEQGEGQRRRYLADMDRVDRMIEQLMNRADSTAISSCSYSSSSSSAAALHVHASVPVSVPVHPSFSLIDLREVTLIPPRDDQDLAAEPAQDSEDDEDDASSVGAGCFAVHPIAAACDLDQGDRDPAATETLASACESSDGSDDSCEEESGPSAAVGRSQQHKLLDTNASPLCMLRNLLRSMRAERERAGPMVVAATRDPLRGEYGGRDGSVAEGLAASSQWSEGGPVDTSSALAMLRSLLRQVRATRQQIHEIQELQSPCCSSISSPYYPEMVSETIS